MEEEARKVDPANRSRTRHQNCARQQDRLSRDPEHSQCNKFGRCAHLLSKPDWKLIPALWLRLGAHWKF